MFGLEEFGAGPRKVIKAALCVPAFVALWFAFIVLKPLYFTALDKDTTLLPKSMTVSPSLAPPTVDYSDPQVNKQKKKKAKAKPGDAGAGDNSFVQARESAKGKGKVGKIGKEKTIKLNADPTKVDLGVCGGAPKELLPTIAFVDGCEGDGKPARAAEPGPKEESSPAVEANSTAVETRRLAHRTVGYTMTGTGCNKKHWTKVYHENDGSGPNIKKNVKPGEEQLVKCLQNIRHCDCGTRKAARALDSIKALDKKLSSLGKVGKGFRRYKTCAIVGNAGHLSEKKYGRYIDNHEFIVRFNVQPVQPFSEYVGSRTSLRVANHRRSLALCCRGNFPEGKAKQNDTGVLIWYPGSQNEIMGNCRRRFPANPIMNLDLRQAKVLAGAVKDMRKNLYRLGVGPFGEWRQLTSGGHAIMFMASICDSISVYGITTYNAADKGGADHYGAALTEGNTRASAQTRARSGQKWHDWKGEKYVWRLLNAAGKVDICSM